MSKLEKPGERVPYREVAGAGIPRREIEAMLRAADWFEERGAPEAVLLRRLAERLLSANEPASFLSFGLERLGLDFSRCDSRVEWAQWMYPNQVEVPVLKLNRSRASDDDSCELVDASYSSRRVTPDHLSVRLAFEIWPATAIEPRIKLPDGVPPFEPLVKPRWAGRKPG